MKARLTEKRIDKLQPPASGMRITYDTTVPGFGVRVTAGNAVAFILEYSICGRQRRYTIGSHPDLSVTAARDKALDLRKAIAGGVDPLEERKKKREAETVKELSERYLEEHAKVHKRASSIYHDTRLLEARILPALGGIRVAELRRDDVEKLHRGLKEVPYLANRVVALLSKMLSLAVEWKLAPTNVAAKVKRYQEHARERWLSREEFARLNSVLDAFPDRDAADAFRLIMLTGSRRSEVLDATWAEFDLERGFWTKPGHRTKTRTTEKVPLSRAALALLCRIKAESRAGERLFLAADIDRKWARIRAAAGLGEVRIHDLRHSFASTLVNRGQSLYLVGKLLGHAQSRTTERYAHAADTALREAVEQFTAVVEPEEKQQADIIPLPVSGRRSVPG